MDEEPYFISECCPNFLGTFGHLEIAHLDFVTEWPCEHTTSKGIAHIPVDCTDHHQTSSECLSWMDEEPYFIPECCPNILGTFGHLEISDLDFVTEWPCEHSSIKGIAPIMIELHQNVYPGWRKNCISYQSAALIFWAFSGT